MKTLLRRTIPAILTLALCIPAASAHTHSNRETVVSDWAAAEIQAAAGLGLIPLEWDYRGPADYRQPILRTDFRQLAMQFVALENNCDEATLNALVAYYLADRDENGDVIDPFTDGLPDDKYAYYLGVVNGRGNGIFDPEGLITREEAAAMLLRAYRVCAPDAQAPAQAAALSDLDTVSDWARESVETITGWGIMKGMDTGDFAPQGTYTIEQCILTFLRLHQKFAAEREEDFAPLFDYESCIGLIEAWTNDYRVPFGWSEEEVYRKEGPVATFVQTWPKHAAMMSTSDFYLIYRDGGMRQVDFGVCSYTGVGRLSTGVELMDCVFSDDGLTLSCNFELHQDVYAGEYGSAPVAHEKGLHTCQVDVLTARPAQP